MKLNRYQIETIMAEQQMTLAQLSIDAGIAKQNISTIIRRGSCYPKTAGKLARGLCVPVSVITEDAAAYELSEKGGGLIVRGRLHTDVSNPS